MLTTITRQPYPHTGKEKLLVIGTDASTTQLSGVSYALLESGKVPKIQSVTRFSGQREESKSNLRIVCYDQDGNVIAVGPKTDPEVDPMPSEPESVRRPEWFNLRLRPPTLAAYKRYQLEKIWSPKHPAEGEAGPPGIGTGEGEVEGDETDGIKEKDPSDTPSREVVKSKLPSKGKMLHLVDGDIKTPIRIVTVFLRYLFKSAKEYIIETENYLALLESEEAHPNHILEENTTALSSAEEAATNRKQLTRDPSATSQTRREGIREMKTAPAQCTCTSSEQIGMLLPPTIVNKEDIISVSEVANLVKLLNAQIEQGSCLITDSLLDQESSSIGKELETVWDELYDYIGSWLCNDLTRRSKEPIVEPNPVITQITLQTGLVNACSRIISDWNPPFWIDGSVLSRTYSNIKKTEGQATADAWRALSRSNMVVFPSERQQANKKYLTEVLLRLITAVGGTLENGILPLQYSEVLEDIVKMSLELHRVISEDLVPMMELVTDTIPCDADFDPSRMEDTEGGRNETGLVTQDPVICTTEMGLQYRKKERGSGDEWSVVKKAKVVLASTLEE